MTTPSQPGSGKFFLADSHGRVTGSVNVPAKPAVPPKPATPPPTPAVRTDPGWFKRLITNLNPLRQNNRTAMAMSGLGVAALALDVAATLNLGNPFLFYDRREQWKDMGSLLSGNRADLWRSYFDVISPNWKGQAVETLQQYVRFNINGLYSELGKMTGEMSGTMHRQFKEVGEYDLSVFGLYATSAPILRTLASASFHPVGRVALMTQAGIFMSALGNLVKQFADVYYTYEGDLNTIELKLNELRGAFYKSGNPDLGPRSLNLTPSIEDPALVSQNWIPFTKETS
ncbi:hypothetical protein [Nonomuraea typhae]|uniref:hypothetical protein n=1 Tax=Nonomuraea typhae TaxID=2603600 RepID=UPI0012F958E7|nr:hypothetical protein [Nonomuraea typhae]